MTPQAGYAVVSMVKMLEEAAATFQELALLDAEKTVEEEE
jgi:hypothetical protein